MAKALENDYRVRNFNRVRRKLFAAINERVWLMSGVVRNADGHAVRQHMAGQPSFPNAVDQRGLNRELYFRMRRPFGGH